MQKKVHYSRQNSLRISISIIYDLTQSINEDVSGRNCIEFASDGFRCVPFYACNGGEIITNGDGIVDIRGANLAPLDSKCSGEIEVCCRHPDWKGCRTFLTKYFQPYLKKIFPSCYFSS